MRYRRCLAILGGTLLLAQGVLLSPSASRAEADREAQAAVTSPPKAEQPQRTAAMEFVRIPGGEFDMGANDGDRDEKPVHRVRISDFRMMKSEVTQAQWAAVMGSNPSNNKGCDDCPVEYVSWADVQVFIGKESARTGEALRLPTEAEWEYAAGGGAAHQKYAGTDNEEELGEYFWNYTNSGDKTHPVCQKRPNQFGLCDMSGNVWEWCSDLYSDAYYSQSPPDNPPGSSMGTERVYRGGSKGAEATSARTANRVRLDPSYRYFDLGFRLVAP